MVTAASLMSGAMTMKTRGRVLKTSIRWQASSAVIAFLGMTVGPMAVAEIEVTPRLQLRQSWTDTANLDAIGGADGDFVTTISPGVNISGATERVQAFIDYTLNGLVFWGNSGQSDIRHDLNGAVNTEVVRNRFFVDLRASVNQQFQDFGNAFSPVAENFTDNRFTVQNYSVTPRWREDIGNFAVAETSYTFNLNKLQNDGEQTFANPGAALADSTGHRVNFNLRNGPKFNRFTWNWNTSYQQINRELNNFDFEAFESIADLSYSLNRKVALLASIGYEDIRDDTLLGAQTGVVWDVGARFQPGPRTDIEARVGRRFNDWVYSGLFSYQFNDTDTVSANYSEDLTVGPRFGLSNFANNTILDNRGVPIPTLTDPALGPGAFFSDAAFRQKRANLTLSRNLRKTTIRGTGFWEKQLFETGLGRQTVAYGGSVEGQYRLDQAQTVSASLLYRHNNFGNINGSDDFIAFSPSYTYAISRNLSASADYTYTRRFSDVANFNRATNTISLTFIATF